MRKTKIALKELNYTIISKALLIDRWEYSIAQNHFSRGYLVFRWALLTYSIDNMGFVIFPKKDFMYDKLIEMAKNLNTDVKDLKDLKDLKSRSFFEAITCMYGYIKNITRIIYKQNPADEMIRALLERRPTELVMSIPLPVLSILPLKISKILEKKGIKQVTVYRFSLPLFDAEDLFEDGLVFEAINNKTAVKI